MAIKIADLRKSVSFALWSTLDTQLVFLNVVGPILYATFNSDENYPQKFFVVFYLFRDSILILLSLQIILITICCFVFPKFGEFVNLATKEKTVKVFLVRHLLIFVAVGLGFFSSSLMYPKHLKPEDLTIGFLIFSMLNLFLSWAIFNYRKAT